MSARGMTQEALANEVDRGQSWVNHKLSGRRKTNVEDIVLIAQALDIPPAVLLENLSDPDQLRASFLESGTAEPTAEYALGPLAKIEDKFDQLDPSTQTQFIDQVESMLDMLIASKR